MNRRGFIIKSLFASAALATGLARTTIALVEDKLEFTYSRGNQSTNDSFEWHVEVLEPRVAMLNPNAKIKISG